MAFRRLPPFQPRQRPLRLGSEFGRAGVDNPTVGDSYSWDIVSQPDGRIKAIDLLHEGAEFAARPVFEPIRQ